MLYINHKGYKNLSDKGIIKTARRGVALGFVASFIIFTFAQWALPSIFNFGRPEGARASSNTKTWTADADFLNNASTTNSATTRVLETLAGTVTVVSGSKTVTGLGTSFTTTVATYNPMQITIAGATYGVASVTNATSLQLSNNYPGANASGLTITRNSETILPGSVTLTNNSSTVTGIGTNFLSTVNTFSSPKQIRINGSLYTVASVASDTSLTLSSNFVGTTKSGLSLSYDNVTVNNNTIILHSSFSTPTTLTTTGSGTWQAPVGVTAVQVEAWGAGGNGFSDSGGGGGGGGYAKKNIIPVTAGNTYSYYVAAGGSGGQTWFINNTTVAATSGANSTGSSGGAAGNMLAGDTGIAGTSGSSYGGSSDSCGNNLTGGNGGKGANGGAGGTGGRSYWDGEFCEVPVDISPTDGGTPGGGGGGVPSFGQPIGLGARGQITITPLPFVPTGTISALKYDSGAGLKSKWNQLSWNTVENVALPTNTSIKFRAATSDDNVNWTWSGYYTQTSGSSFTQSISALSASRYLQLEATLTSADPLVSPTINDINITFNTLDSPSNPNILISGADGTGIRNISGEPITAGQAGGNTNQTSIKVTVSSLICSSCSPVPANIWPDVEIQPINAAFTGTPTSPGVSGNNFVIASGLVSGTSYHMQVRSQDSDGRVSAWAPYGGNLDNNPPTTPAQADFTVDQTLPTVGAFTLKGNTSNSSYVNNSDSRIAKADIQLSDNVATSLDIQFSEDGVNGWGAYNIGTGSNTLDSSWGTGSYKTVTGVTSSQSPKTISDAWKFSLGEGNITLYVRVRDAANNIVMGTPNTTKYGLGGDTGKTAPGPYTYTVPAGVTSLSIDIKGAGGGGAGDGFYCDGAAGVSGTLSKIKYSVNNNEYIANGGGAGINCDLPGSPGSPAVLPAGFTNIASPAVGGGASGGAGSGGNGYDSDPGAPGGAGARVLGTITGLSGGTFSITVGTGGIGGASAEGNPAIAGSPGLNGSVSLTYVIPFSAQITLDTVAPTYSGSLVLANTANWLKQGQAQTVTANFTETMTTAPKINIDYSSNGSNEVSAINMTGSGQSWSYSFTIPSGNEGTATVTFSGTDLAGNAISGAPTGNTFGVDNTSPSATVDPGKMMSAFYKTTSINVPYTAFDEAQTVTGYGEYINECWGWPTNGVGPYFPGDARFDACVYEADEGYFSAHYTTAPDLSRPIYSPVTLSGVHHTNLYYTRQTSGFTDWKKYTGATTNSTSSPFTFDTAQISDANKNGNYGFKLVATDNVGNISAVPDTSTAPDATTYIDSELPDGAVMIDGGAIATQNLSNIPYTFTLKDDFSGLDKYRTFNGTTWSGFTTVSGSTSGTVSGTVTFEDASQGLKTLTVEVFDRAGNSAVISDSIAYDSTPPSFMHAPIARNSSDTSQILVENGATLGWYPFSSVNFILKADDAESGIKEFEYCYYKSTEAECNSYSKVGNATKVEGSDYTYQTNFDVTLTDDRQGVLNFKFRGLDYVGLTSSVTTFTYKFDKTLPSALNNFSASKGSEPSSVKLTWDDPFTNPTPRAPIQKFKVERILAEDFTGAINYDGIWSGVSSYYSKELDVVGDAAILVKVGNQYVYNDQTMLNSVKYLYRVSAKDFSNDSFGSFPTSDPEFIESGYGYTKDTQAPGVYPSGVIASACTSNLSAGICSGTNMKGKQVQVKWLPAEDNGAGIDYYEIYRREGGSTEASGWSVVGTTQETSDALNQYRVFYDNAVVDAKNYSYRVVVYDRARPLPANKTDLFRGNDITNTDNATKETANVPDITAPAIPSTFSVTADGIDYIADETGSYHQKVTTAWKQTTDNNVLTNISYELYFAQVNSPESFSLIDTQNSSPFVLDGHAEADRISYKKVQTGLADKTNFYYYLKVSDSAGNIATSSVKSATTGNSAAPTPPTGVEVHNDLSDTTDPSTQLFVKFRGSLAKNCDEVTKTDCIVSYEAYRAETNIEVDIDGTLTPNIDTDNCNLAEGPDECWIRVNNAILANTQQPQPPIGNETLSPKRTFLATGLSEATKYYFRVRAVDNNADAPLKSPLSAIYPELIHVGGWDTTRDLTAPELPAGGLEVKVKDTHPNTSIMRNIVSWKILDKAPLRKKMEYETPFDEVNNPNGCKTVIKDGVEYCNDFGRFEVYRQILDGVGNVAVDTETPIATITDPAENFYIDSIGINETLGGGGLLINAKIRYYVRVFDSSLSNFKYPDGSNINATENKSSKQLSSDTIIPASAKPKLVGQVGVEDISVASAVINWATDQDADSLVQYRPMKKSGDTWAIDDGSSFITVGQVERTTSHSVKIFALKPQTRYEYKLVSRNYLDNRVEYDEKAVPEVLTTGYTITKGNVVSTTTGTEINWVTNLDADSAFVEYQMNKQPGDDPQGKTVGVNPDELAANPRVHRVVIQGLKSNRTYTYKIKSISKDGYVAETEFSTFATKSYDTAQFTMAPNSSNVAERNITSTTAQITWATSAPSTSWVDYATKAGIKGQEKDGIKSAGSNELTLSHAVQIDGLVPGTKYYYIVRSKDANDIEYTSQEYSFTAVLKPKISNLRVSDVKPYSITLEWDTNVDTETILNWGKTSGYGEKRGKNEITKLHKIVIEGLEDNTEYHYQILAKDETGNEVADDDKVVRTPLDTDGPQIENVKTDILPIGTDDAYASVIVSWQTNKPATTLVEYDEGIIGGKYTLRSTEDKTLNNSHTVIIKELKPAASYHFKIVSKDKRGNIGQSPDHTFVTPSKEKSILQLILKSLEETFSWTKNMGKFFGNVGKRATGGN